MQLLRKLSELDDVPKPAARSFTWQIKVNRNVVKSNCLVEKFRLKSKIIEFGNVDLKLKLI